MFDQYRFEESHRAVLYGVQEVTKDVVGSNKPISSSTLLIGYLKEVGAYEELDLADLFYRIDRCFEIRIPISEWKKFMQSERRDPADWEKDVAKRVTFGHIAAFVAARLPIAQVSSLRILGKDCMPAGAFRAIEHFVGRYDADGERFGPSTPIRDRLRGSKLKRVWKQLRWLSEGRLPVLRMTPSEMMLGTLIFITLLAVVVTIGFNFLVGFSKETFEEFGAVSSVITGWLTGLAIVAGVISWLLSPVLNRIESKLPSGFRTFRDIAMAMAPGD